MNLSFDRIKSLIKKFSRGDGYHTYTIPGTKLLSIQANVNSDADKIAYTDIRRQVEQAGLTIEDIEKQHKEFNEACNRIFR